MSDLSAGIIRVNSAVQSLETLKKRAARAERALRKWKLKVSLAELHLHQVNAEFAKLVENQTFIVVQPTNWGQDA